MQFFYLFCNFIINPYKLMHIKNHFSLFFLLLFNFCTSSQINQFNQFKFQFNPLSEKTKKHINTELENKYNKLFKNSFSGEIIVTKNGQIVFEKYAGYFDVNNKILINEKSPIHLASISKTFTATVILRLIEQHKIALTDNITQFFPNFPYPNINIELLLTHRSGLPNYVYFFDKYKLVSTYSFNKRHHRVKKIRRIKNENLIKEGFLNNQDILDYIIKYKPAIQYLPNQTFNYCNTNYMLLALIIEKVTKLPYATYLSDSIFKPLGMTHSFVLNNHNKNLYVPSYQANNTPFNLQKVDFIYGDKNIYSTAKDMYLWDLALYNQKIISRESILLACSAKSTNNHTVHNYGYGWRILKTPNEEIIYHNGWWHGNNTVFTRFIKDTISIIVLGNKFNRQIYKSKELRSVFNGIDDKNELLE